MVAGACGIDFALLLVAADDGVMPQTREHLAILELLGIRLGAVALSKADRVDSKRLKEVQAEVTAALASTTLRYAPMFPVNATVADDPGTASLRGYLQDIAARLPPRRDERLFRLAVDRVFTLAGRGTVVTGTVFSGHVRTNDTVAVMPAGTLVRVRSIHTQNRAAESGGAGQRCALNLAGVKKSSLSRGDWLAEPRLFAPTTRVDVHLRLLPGSGLHLKSWSPLHVHLGTMRRVAHAALLGSADLLAGESARVQLVFDTPICAIPGDRFIARDAQAAHTVGGGVVLDPFAPSRKRRSPARAHYLDALEQLIAGEGVTALLQQAPYGVKLADLARLTGLPPELIPLPAQSITIHCAHEPFVLLAPHWLALRERAVSALRAFHAQVPDELGPVIGRLRLIAMPDLPDALWRALIDALVHERIVMRSAPWLHLPEHAMTLSEGDQALARRLQPLIIAGRFDPPWVRDLAASAHEPEVRVREVLRKQVTQNTVYQVVRDLFYDRECIGELAAVVTTIAREHGAVNAARYRDAVGLGRKRAIQILEFFDRVGFTRRVQDSHVLRRDSGWRTSE
jgi:selenocysteine-specific elongation factor